jgi:hypothetical protein
MAEAPQPEPDAPEISVSVAALAVSFAFRSRGQDGLVEIFRRVGAEDVQRMLSQPDLWVSFAEVRAVIDAAASICDELDIGYQLGEEAARVMFD